MKKKNISEAIGNINQKYINEAVIYAGELKALRHNKWTKWRAIAACFAIVAVLGVGIFQGVFSSRKQIATLDNGNTISFVKSGSGIGQLDISVQIETRDLTVSESKALFNEIPVKAYAVFNSENGSVIGLEGEVSDVKLIVSVPDIMLKDTVIEGEENVSNVNGVSVNAGYFINDKNAIYYATFKLGENTVYVEHAGAKEESEKIKNEISTVIQNLTVLGEIDLAQISK